MVINLSLAVLFIVVINMRNISFFLPAAIAAALIAFVGSYNANAQNIAPKGLEAYLKKEMQKRKIPGLQIAIVRNGKIVMLGSYGLANIENNIPVDNRTIFSINSATKSFTGVAVMQLAEEGKIDLEAPVSAYLDDLPEAWRPVKIRQLLAHLSGIPNIMDGNGNLLAADDFNASLAKALALPMEFKPGSRFSYNQTNYFLIGKVIEKISGKPFIQFIKERQFAPAGMKKADWGDFYDVVPNKAKPYAYNRFGESKFSNHYEAFPAPLRAAAGINTTAQELAAWIIALGKGKLLKKEGLLALWKSEVSDINYLLNGYALGFPSIVRAGHSAVGGIGGGRSAFLIYPEDDLAIVVLTNRLGASPEQFIDEIAGFYIPSMKAETGFGLPPAIKTLRTELLKTGFEKARDVVKTLKANNPGFQLGEAEVNHWGYLLIRQDKPKEALEIFKLNTALYPESANVYDSLAEAYEINGDKALAIKNYKRSLELDPKNGNAIAQLKRLETK